MNKEYVFGFGVGLVFVLAPLVAFGRIGGDWLRGGVISMNLGSWVSTLGTVALLAGAARRWLRDRVRRREGSTDVL